MSLLVVAGARPQFIKAAALMPALPDAQLVHTGQHRDPRMVEAHFAGLGLAPPDHVLTLAATARAARHDEMTASLVDLLERVRPRRVIALGDTDSTRAAAIAAAMTKTPVAHVEAGARSGEPNLPEEINRVVVDGLSDLLLCSTAHCAAHLSGRQNVHVVGDVMADVLLRYEAAIRAKTPDRDPYVVLTLHRAATADDPQLVADVVAAVCRAAGQPVLFPRHPRTTLREKPTGLTELEPLPYLEFLGLVAGASAVVTDSGGLQKEAYLLGVPCITLRERTEWLETVESGWNVLVGTDPDRIAHALASPPRAPTRPSHYGDGAAAERIAKLV